MTGRAVGQVLPPVRRHVALPRYALAEQVAAIVELMGLETAVWELGTGTDNETVGIVQGGSHAVLVEVEEDGAGGRNPLVVVPDALYAGGNLVGTSGLVRRVVEAHLQDGG